MKGKAKGRWTEGRTSCWRWLRTGRRRVEIGVGVEEQVKVVEEEGKKVKRVREMRWRRGRRLERGREELGWTRLGRGSVRKEGSSWVGKNVLLPREDWLEHSRYD